MTLSASQVQEKITDTDPSHFTDPAEVHQSCADLKLKSLVRSTLFYQINFPVLWHTFWYLTQ